MFNFLGESETKSHLYKSLHLKRRKFLYYLIIRLFITGGGTEIGKATAKRFIQEGVKVVINGRRENVFKENVKEITQQTKMQFMLLVLMTPLIPLEGGILLMKSQQDFKCS
ncbi:MAG: SDR family NAD(P)-dependent oxidoreductase [Bacillota bacterium]